MTKPLVIKLPKRIMFNKEYFVILRRTYFLKSELLILRNFHYLPAKLLFWVIYPAYNKATVDTLYTLILCKVNWWYINYSMREASVRRLLESTLTKLSLLFSIVINYMSFTEISSQKMLYFSRSWAWSNSQTLDFQINLTQAR